MDLDALAGVVAYKHTGPSVMTVTAAVDRITVKRPLSAICDLELSGQVTFATGRSSMEISLQVAKVPEEGQALKEKDILMTCAFTMVQCCHILHYTSANTAKVSLDPATKKPVPVNPLTTSTPEEKLLFQEGEANYNLKKAESKMALRKQTPNDEESDLIHALWLRQLDYHGTSPLPLPSPIHHLTLPDPNTASRKPDNALWMASTEIQSVAIMQPQFRNRHNFMIFGGFLLKSTFELAFTCASAISHTRPTFIALDPSTFQNPVPVGSVLYLTATVAYTDSPLVPSADLKASPAGSTRIQVRVDSKIRNIEHGETKPTGQFNYTFEVKRDITIVPQTYSQFMMYLDARRRSQRVTASLAEGRGKSKRESVME
jgi:acyl-coenzyme A thioesterase 9